MISVIVPVYNSAPYLKVCIESILGQIYSDFELILVDDGSTDESALICEEYKNKDSRVHVIHQNNKGAAAARNSGIYAATGEFFTFIDSDDVVTPYYLKNLSECLENIGADIAVCEFQKFSMQSPKLESNNTCNEFRRVIAGKEACDLIVNDHKTQMIVVWGKLYSKKVKDLCRFPEGKYAEDEFICYQLMYGAEMIAFTDTVDYFYRQRTNSLSSGSFNLKTLDKLEALKGAAVWLREKNELDLESHALKRYLLGIEIMWRKARIGGADPSILKKLKEQHQACMKESYHRIWDCCTILEKITLSVFRISPMLYCVIAGIYMSLFGED